MSAARTGVAVFADDFQTIKVFAERDNTDIVHWSRHERGGHFAALGEPPRDRHRPTTLLRLSSAPAVMTPGTGRPSSR